MFLLQAKYFYKGTEKICLVAQMFGLAQDAACVFHVCN